MLREDGYDELIGGGGNPDRAAEIKRAELRGCLSWSKDSLTTSDSSRISITRGVFRIMPRTSLLEIRDKLIEHGYLDLVDDGGNLDRAEEIKRAALAGHLSWDKNSLVTTDGSRISAIPNYGSLAQVFSSEFLSSP